MDDRFDLVYRLLDDQIVDVDGRRCGRVDDIELIGAPGEPLRIGALLTGRGAYAPRIPARFRGLARKLFGDDVRGATVQRVPWSQVEDVEATVRLYGRAEDLGLDRDDRALQRPFERLPGG
jgi:sporulation protein YlmC with PRC-barrel domain